AVGGKGHRCRTRSRQLSLQDRDDAGRNCAHLDRKHARRECRNRTQRQPHGDDRGRHAVGWIVCENEQLMSRDASIGPLSWADGKYTFKLSWGELALLQEAT